METLTIILYSIACLSFGLRLLRLLARRFEYSTSENTLVVLCSAFLLGQGVLATFVWQLVALARVFTPPVIAILCLIVFLSGVMLFPDLLRNILAASKTTLRAWVEESIVWKIVIALGFLAIIITGLLTYLPPQPRGDGLAFYLSFARLVAETGELSTRQAVSFFAQVGLQGEFHYAALFALSTSNATQLFTWFTALAGVGVLVGLARYCGVGYRGKWLITISAFTSSAFSIVIWDGKVDMFGAALGLAAYYWAFRANDYPGGALYLAGLFTGLAIIAKISYAVFLPLTIGLIIFWRYYVHTDSPLWHKGKLRFIGIIQLAFILAFWGALPAIPHIIKNTVVFDAPLAPVISDAGSSIVEQSWFTDETTNRILLTYPFALTFGNFWAQGGQISPLILAFTPLLLLLKLPEDDRKRSLLLQVGLIAVLAVVIWIVYRASVFAPRYMMSPLMLWFIPVAFAVEYITLSNKRKVLTAIIPLMILVVTFFFLLHHQLFITYAARMVSGEIGECDYEYTNRDGSCRSAQIINAEAPEGSTILLASYFDYWLRSDLMQCKLSAEFRDDGMNWDQLYDHDVRYIIVDTLTHRDIYSAITHSLPEQIELDTIFEADSYIAFRVNIEYPENALPDYSCQQVPDSSAIWRITDIRSETP